MPNILNLFSNPVYEVEFPNFDGIQQDVINTVTQNFNNEFINEYHQHAHPLRMGALIRIYEHYANDGISNKIENENLKRIFDFITEHGKEYWKILNLSRHLDPYVLQLWVTAVKQGGFIASHNHNPVPVSGVFYIKAEPRLGNLFLENPLDLILGKSPYQADERTPTRFNFEIQAMSGKLILFPGWMKHFTSPNPTDEIRLSMAVNFGCHGEVHFTELI
jgi:hypothetical protein